MNWILDGLNDLGVELAEEGAYWYFPTNKLGSNQKWNEMPTTISGQFMVGGKITNCKMEYFYRIREVNGEVHLGEVELYSLSGIGKICFKRINGSFLTNNSVQSSILGLMLVKDLTGVVKDFTSIRSDSYHKRKMFDNRFAFDIINAHIESEEHDLLECQEELIVNNMKEFARL